MRFFGIFLCLSAAPSYAHVGHWGDLAGHSHWAAAAALGAAAAVAVWAGRKKSKKPDQESEPATESQEA
ncbi:hypothetical protein GCM10007939_15580 [Amylibacter marinus]|uniref:LPXTG cell wall anchor domain-containing protein n=1 Tax=Amylibacter marinus TaxID=1475483 RepID=A0ABQ5VVI3_9RHOB|nr:DUF6732 family protein [Amylibacter marinus]GLQ35275.1 hypothetical protein GCM10007939_15580 [Amylibacter marinus]